MNVVLITPAIRALYAKARMPLGATIDTIIGSDMDDLSKGLIYRMQAEFYKRLRAMDKFYKFNDLIKGLPTWVKHEIKLWYETEIRNVDLMTDYQHQPVVEIEGDTVIIIADISTIVNVKGFETLLDTAIDQAVNIENLDIFDTELFMDTLVLKLILRNTNG